MLKFNIEQIAFYPADPAAAKELLTAMGHPDWAEDHVVAAGDVFGRHGLENEADLSFNYTALKEARELEVLHYTTGENWMEHRTGATPRRASHIGMHCSEAELAEWRNFFAARKIKVAQEVRTSSHTNPVIAGKREYHYVIFDTYDILGIDVKFIVRKDLG